MSLTMHCSLLLPANSIKLCSAHAGGAQVRLDGIDIRELSLMWYRSQFALVSQLRPAALVLPGSSLGRTRQAASLSSEHAQHCTASQRACSKHVSRCSHRGIGPAPRASTKYEHAFRG